jgi:hypothetical protein
MNDPLNRLYEEWSRQELQFLVDARACSNEGRRCFTWRKTTELFCKRFGYEHQTGSEEKLKKLFASQLNYKKMHEEVGLECQGFPLRMLAYVARVQPSWAKENFLPQDQNLLEMDYPYNGEDQMYFRYDEGGNLFPEPNDRYVVRENEKVPAHLGEDGKRYVEKYKTTLRVWSMKEDTALRDLMAVKPRGTSKGMAAVLQDMFERLYDHFALGEYWRRNRRRIIACNKVAHPERFNVDDQDDKRSGISNYGINGQKATEAPGDEPFAWKNEPNERGLFYLM